MKNKLKTIMQIEWVRNIGKGILFILLVLVGSLLGIVVIPVGTIIFSVWGLYIVIVAIKEFFTEHEKYKTFYHENKRRMI